jgi:hypothetical protein
MPPKRPLKRTRLRTSLQPEMAGEHASSSAPNNADKLCADLSLAESKSPSPSINGASLAHRLKPTRKTADSSSPLIKIVVGPAPTPGTPAFQNITQRTFYVSRRLLEKNSTLLNRDLAPSFANPHYGSETNPVLLPESEPFSFAAWISFCHSGIYSLNKNVPAYDPISKNIGAYLAGEQLGCALFQDAALRKLYNYLEPQARVGVRRRRNSPIRAGDVEAVCIFTSPQSSLRMLLFDAVASHWSRAEVMNIGSEGRSTPFASTSTLKFHATNPFGGLDQQARESDISWLDVYNRHSDFRATLAASLIWEDQHRGYILASCEDYVKGTKKEAEQNIRDAQAKAKAKKRKQAREEQAAAKFKTRQAQRVAVAREKAKQAEMEAAARDVIMFDPDITPPDMCDDDTESASDEEDIQQEEDVVRQVQIQTAEQAVTALTNWEPHRAIATAEQAMAALTNQAPSSVDLPSFATLMEQEDNLLASDSPAPSPPPTSPTRRQSENDNVGEQPSPKRPKLKNEYVIAPLSVTEEQSGEVDAEAEEWETIEGVEGGERVDEQNRKLNLDMRDMLARTWD